MSEPRNQAPAPGAVALHEGAPARALLDDASFIDAWARLYRASARASAFQSPEFVTAWFRHYPDQYLPWLLVARRLDGELDAMLPLAHDRRSGALVVAGAHQAEYQAWLGRGDGAAEFLDRAWRIIRARLPGATLTFKYLPAAFAAQVTSLASSPLRNRIEIVPRRRPLMQLSVERIEESLRKKGNKSKLNRLARLGEVRLERLRSAEALGRWFDDIITHYDVRQGATHDSCPFHSDPHKRPFHLALAEHPERLHVTVLSVGGRFAAAHIGAITDDTVHLGIIAHSPFYAEHSVGKLQLLLLGRHLAQEGFKTFDLTPGDDPWKERFADAHDEVYELRMFPSTFARLRAAAPGKAMGLAKRAAAVFGITPARVRGWQASRRRPANGAAAAAGAFECWRRSDAIVPGTAREPLARDALGDLLLCPEPARRVFLATALERLEQGEHVYTRTQNGKLLYCAWVQSAQDAPALLHDVQSTDAAALEELLAANLAKLPTPILVRVGSEAAHVIAALQRLGFERAAADCGSPTNTASSGGAAQSREDA
jgi:CelD/BcsL family acetyltransferase involved in cellulose biosynthesis